MFRVQLISGVIVAIFFACIMTWQSAWLATYAQSSSAPITGPADTIPPTVTLTFPKSIFLKGANYILKAKATDNVGVTGVEFIVDNAMVGTDGTAPYTAPWDTGPLTDGSSHSIIAATFDTSGNIATSSAVTVIIDKTKPLVSITNPQNGGTVVAGSESTITADASDSLSGVFRVDFLVNGVLICRDKTLPFACSWTVPAGSGISYTLKTRAVDLAGNTSFPSTSIVTSQ